MALTENASDVTYDTQKQWEYTHYWKQLAVGTHLHAQNRTKTTPVFLPADAGVSWLLLPSLFSLLSSSTV